MRPWMCCRNSQVSGVPVLTSPRTVSYATASDSSSASWSPSRSVMPRIFARTVRCASIYSVSGFPEVSYRSRRLRLGFSMSPLYRVRKSTSSGSWVVRGDTCQASQRVSLPRGRRLKLAMEVCFRVTDSSSMATIVKVSRPLWKPNKDASPGSDRGLCP